MSKKVLDALTVKYSKVQEGVGKIMGGKILDYEAKDILNRGKAESILEILLEFGTLPEELQASVLSERDTEVLRKWVKLAAKVKSIDEFRDKMNE